MERQRLVFDVSGSSDGKFMLDKSEGEAPLVSAVGDVDKLRRRWPMIKEMIDKALEEEVK